MMMDLHQWQFECRDRDFEPSWQKSGSCDLRDLKWIDGLRQGKDWLVPALRATNLLSFMRQEPTCWSIHLLSYSSLHTLFVQFIIVMHVIINIF